ncbi:uncharacterized protein P884DRAFT_86827 [Thermothelomyces heterothallicus CBS 202.75]|uniref:uncharacterized protein n=1 Tax=Thermothelomyces heterothallicus CBS 202.75 TaxID=1149848 RepID=UPI0037421E5A
MVVEGCGNCPLSSRLPPECPISFVTRPWRIVIVKRRRIWRGELCKLSEYKGPGHIRERATRTEHRICNAACEVPAIIECTLLNRLPGTSSMSSSPQSFSVGRIVSPLTLSTGGYVQLRSFSFYLSCSLTRDLRPSLFRHRYLLRFKHTVPPFGIPYNSWCLRTQSTQRHNCLAHRLRRIRPHPSPSCAIRPQRLGRCQRLEHK